MSGRTQFILGSVMMALAIGLLIGTLAVPPSALGQGVEGRGPRYALLTGVAGIAPQTETVYIVDDSNELVMIFEYNPRTPALSARNAVNLRGDAAALIKLRAQEKEPKE